MSPLSGLTTLTGLTESHSGKTLSVVGPDDMLALEVIARAPWTWVNRAMLLSSNGHSQCLHPRRKVPGQSKKHREPTQYERARRRLLATGRANEIIDGLIAGGWLVKWDIP